MSNFGWSFIVVILGGIFGLLLKLDQQQDQTLYVVATVDVYHHAPVAKVEQAPIVDQTTKMEVETV